MGRDHLSIGEVLALIKGDFPDVTVSKIRFLEGQGLLEPERTPSGYRKFSEHDLERLRWILVQQRDHFLPLKVIKARLDGEEVARGSATGDQIELPLGDLAPLIDAPPAAPPSNADPGDSEDVAGSDPEVESEETDRAVRASGAAPLMASSAGFNGGGFAAPARTNGDSADDGRDPGAWLEELAAGRTPQPSGAGPASDGPSAEDHMATLPDSMASGAEPDADHTETDETSVDETDVDEADAEGHESDVISERSDPDPDPLSGDAPVMIDEPESEPVNDDAATSSNRERDAGMSEPLRSTASWLDLDGDDVTLTRAELAEASGLSEPALADLENFGLITAHKSGPVEVYGRTSLQVATHAKAFHDQGLEARHLRMYLVSAEREAAFLENLVLPLLHRRNDGGRAEAIEILDELGSAGLNLRDALLRGRLETYLTDG